MLGCCQAIGVYTQTWRRVHEKKKVSGKEPVCEGVACFTSWERDKGCAGYSSGAYMQHRMRGEAERDYWTR
jgi:hypothetical protein